MWTDGPDFVPTSGDRVHLSPNRFSFISFENVCYVAGRFAPGLAQRSALLNMYYFWTPQHFHNF